MTQAEARERIRRLLDQSDANDTQFTNEVIDDVVDLARRMLASILPEKRLLKLHAGEGGDLVVSSGFAAYPADFLKRLNSKEVKVDGIYAAEITDAEIWRLKFLEDNPLTQSGTSVKYFRETGEGIKTYPSSANGIEYPYLKVPATLGTANNTDLPKDIEDLSIDYAFERLMNTQRGDLELAISLAKDKGYRIEEIKRNR